MNDYSQPEFYRFNRDSLLLVSWIKKNTDKADEILDLGAGSGILGIELSKIYRPKLLTLVELQHDFEPHLKKNIETYLTGDTKVELILSSFGNFSSGTRYDLIVCNPPYYFPESGESSKDLRRGFARSFMIDGWQILLEKIKYHLKDDGKASIVVKNDEIILDRIRKYSLGMRGLFEKNEDLVIVELKH